MLKPKFFDEIVQICVVTDNCKAMVEKYVDEYGIGPWNIFTFNDQVVGHKVHGKDIWYNAKVAMCDCYPINLEIVEPLDDKSQYAEFLKEHGPGMHHIKGTLNCSYEEAAQYLIERGCEEVMCGSFPGHAVFHYWDMRKEIGMYVELVEFLPDPPDGPPFLYDEHYPAGE